MTKQDIIESVKSLDLPKGSFIVFGSCPLALFGIRESNDIDLLVSPRLAKHLKQAGWRQIIKGPKDRPYVYQDFEAHTNWSFSAYKPTLSQLLKTATVVNGVPFASLNEVRNWKVASARPKDLIDIELIDNYQAAKA